MTNTGDHETRIGLALSGGGARGVSHVGVLTVLLEAGIPIDFVSGTSAGAILGAVYCAGLPIDQIRAAVPHIGWRRLITRSASPIGVFQLDRLERWLIMMLGDLTFAELKTPLAIVTMDAETGQRVVVREGNVARAVRATCSVPGFISPVRIGGRFLADGGIIDNLPDEAARELGADFVIGVDIFAPTRARSDRWGPFGPGLTAIETMVRNAGGGPDAADFLIAPDLSGFSFVRFSQADRLMAAGERAARECLPALQARLAELAA